MRDYNFFSAYDKKKELKISPSSPYFIAGIILLVAVLATAGLVVRNMLLESDIQALQDETAALQATAEYQEAMQAQQALDRLNEYEINADAVLTDFENHDLLGTTFLDQLTASLPNNVTTLNLSMNNAAFMGNFRIPDRKTGAELILRLEESGLFSEVHTSGLTQAEGLAGYTISIQCEVKAGEVE